MNCSKAKHVGGCAVAVLCLAVPLMSCEGSGGSSDSSGLTAQTQTCYETSINNCGSGPWDPFGLALAFAWWGGLCTKEVTCSATPAQSDLSAGLVTDDYIQTNWTSNSLEEREPNDSVDEAMPLIVQDDGSVLLTGVINDATDTADFFAFATESFDLHAIYICASIDDCLLPFYQGDALYIELLDQNGTVMQSTQFAQTGNGHEIVYTPSPDLRYYAVVRAANTGGADFSYKLVLTD